MFKFLREKDNQPVLVVVYPNRTYEAFAFHNPPSSRDKRLFAMLEKMGGVNESVEPGYYHFNMRRLGFHYEVTLVPQED